jgi:Ca2+-binding EF-hand superfamily protein
MPAVRARGEFAVELPMKRLLQTPLLLSATLFLAGGLHAADETNSTQLPTAPAMMKGSRADDLLKRFDTNHDGKLDEDEVAAAHEAMLKEQMERQATVAMAPGGAEFRRRMLAMFDRNHDGQLDDDERAEMRKYVEDHGLGPDGEVRAELLKRFDKNADGKLDEGERADMEKFLQERRAQSATMREFLLRQFDRNGNGRIDADELPDLEKAMRRRMESNPQQLARYDKDGDGKLNDSEWAIAREQLLRILNNPPPASVAASEAGMPADQVELDQISTDLARRRAESLQRAQAAQGETKPPQS